MAMRFCASAHSATVQDGVHLLKPKDETMTDEQKKVMRTQDIRYVEMKRVSEMKVGLVLPVYVYLLLYHFKVENNGLHVSVFQKIERMKSELHLLDVDEEKKNKHVFYVDSKQEGNLV